MPPYFFVDEGRGHQAKFFTFCLPNMGMRCRCSFSGYGQQHMVLLQYGSPEFVYIILSDDDKDLLPTGP